MSSTPHPPGPDGHDYPHDPHPHPHDHPHPHPHPHGAEHEHGHRGGRWARLRHHLVPHSHDAGPQLLSAQEASGVGIRAAWVGLAGMGATAVLQLVVVAVSGSVALLADTVHNLGHAVTTIPLVVAFHLGRRAADRRFGYGYRRAEDLAGVLIALVIAASVVLIVVESVDALLHPRPPAHLGWVFAAGLVGAVGNELVAVYRIRHGRRIGSAALVAEGRHARADGLTSVGVVLGAVGVWLGFERADAVAGLAIGLVVLGILVATVRSIGLRLMDAIEPETVDAMTATAARVPGVTSVGRIRARWNGHRIEADAVVRVPAGLTVLQAHAVAEAVEHELLHATPHLQGVVVHLHPEVDEATEAVLHTLTAHHAGPEVSASRRAAAGTPA